MPTLPSNLTDEILDDQTVTTTHLNSAASTVNDKENFGVFGKPNAIVRPVRRRDDSKLTTITTNNDDDELISLDKPKQEQQYVAMSENHTKDIEQKLKKLQREKINKNVIFLGFI